GDVYTTTLINKLFCILVNKMASLDPFGIGIEMEADKPNWFDALNGLPALLGSSINETFELKRLLALIEKFFVSSGAGSVALSDEVYELLAKLDSLILEYFVSTSKNRDFDFWDKSHVLKEKYRHNTKFGFSGKETEVNADTLKGIIAHCIKKIDAGLAKGYDKERNVYYSYFINEVTEYRILNQNFVTPTKFSQKKLPLFLEGQMHALRLSGSRHNAQLLYRGTQKSGLYDKKLKMYKVTAPLQEMTEEIGRCRVFTPGWLENESVWLHMEYKYLLEVLKCGLYEEFYRDLRNALIPFQRPGQYGRSILENSSFLVSSVFPDKSLHGNGFVARLSGSTAEFVNMWLLMNIGKTPFSLDSENRLQLTFSPILAQWLFAKNKTYRFNFLGTIPVTYHNPKMQDTFGKNGVGPVKITFCDASGNPVEINSGTIPSPYAQQVRSRAITSLEIYLG
ncbi:MAG: cellobiose phosphorylase, partial [Candidatus Omnitrophica bacterium]|nr:cellobiose phosphorylase [Candidatus Omnitrophota bacterium]